MTSRGDAPAHSSLAALAADVRRCMLGWTNWSNSERVCPSPEFRDSEWYASLARKLAPQLERPLR